ncbi:uncharacterized protein LOC117314954 [Pecten maximus]|uniref:uncharacterized protein LOC117314954 n=1 Tax=Pecten maximus TaxID=6579 RepID=UPI00145891CC|nr:uncharacterized protein LOC117314954 [Pecten maximus]
MAYLSNFMLQHLWEIYICLVLLYKGHASRSQDASPILQTLVHPGYIHLDWSSMEDVDGNSSVPEYLVYYQIMGITSHSVIQLESGKTDTNISTSSYPGMLFLVRLYKDDHNLVTRFVRSACGRSEFIKDGKVSYLTSPHYPENYQSMTICKWTYTCSAGTWFKVTQNKLILPSDSCQTYINITGQPILCTTSSTARNVFYVTANVTSVKFVGRSTGAIFNFTFEAIPSLTPPANFSTQNIDDVIRVSWTNENPSAPNLLYIVTYNIIPSLVETESHVTSNKSKYDIDVKGHRGQLFNISLCLGMPHWKSNRTIAVIIRSECNESFLINDGQSITLRSPNFPRDIERYSLCTWSISTSPQSYLRISYLDPVGSYDMHLSWKIISVINRNESITHVLGDRRPLVMKSNSIKLQLRTDSQRYSGLRMMVKSVAPPTSSPTNVHVHLTGSDIFITWEAPPREDDIIEYVILYDVIPDVEGQEVRVNASSTQHLLSIRGYEGRLITISIMAVTEDGRSNTSKPVYVRTYCGGNRTLHHRDTMLVISPRNGQNIYPPDVVCKWIISTMELYWLKMSIESFKLENSTGCESDFLEIDGFRHCGSNIQNTLLYKKKYIVIVFASNGHIQDNGFIFSVKAVAPAPEIPERLRVTSSTYGIIVRWTAPNRNPAYVTGYRISYRHQNSSRIQGIITSNSSDSVVTNDKDWDNVILNSDDFVYVINTRHRPGVTFEVWMESLGEAVDSNSTKVVTTRAYCGGTIEFDNRTQYISSINYPSMDNDDIYCFYHVISNNNIRLAFIDLSFQNNGITTSCFHGYLLVDGVDRSCQSNTSSAHTSFLRTRL